jgi:DNA-directed RNA polymerase subunit H (RpoH/RPB5)
MNIEKTKTQIIETVIKNVVEMLTRRGLMDKDSLDDNINKYTKNHPDDQIYKLKLVQDASDKYTYLKLIPSNITAINKTSGIGDFLNSHSKDHCIIIVKDASKKAQYDLRSRFPKAELFKEVDLMIDLLSHDTQPEMRLLTEEEKEDFYPNYYCMTKRHPSRILLSDPVSKYFNGKRGDIFQIVRPSTESGLANSYRVIV